MPYVFTDNITDCNSLQGIVKKTWYSNRETLSRLLSEPAIVDFSYAVRFGPGHVFFVLQELEPVSGYDSERRLHQQQCPRPEPRALIVANPVKQECMIGSHLSCFRILARSLRSFLPFFLVHKMFAFLILAEDSLVSDFLVEPLKRSFQVSVNLYFCHVVLIHPFIVRIRKLAKGHTRSGISR